MKIEGGCYCRKVRYEAEGEPQLRAQCHCRECQYITGGGPNFFMVMPDEGFKYVKGAAKQFSRTDLERPATRDFCPDCGTHILTRSPFRKGSLIIKVGTLDDPGQFGMPDLALFTCDQQTYHRIPDGIPTFEKRPG